MTHQIQSTEMRRIGSALLLAQNRAREEKERADRCESLLKVIVKSDMVGSITEGAMSVTENDMLRESLSLDDWDLLQSLIQENRSDSHMAMSQVAPIPSATYAGTPGAAVVPGTGVDFHQPGSSVFQVAESSGSSTSALSASGEIEHAAQLAMESHARAVREVEDEYVNNSQSAHGADAPLSQSLSQSAAHITCSSSAEPESPSSSSSPLDDGLLPVVAPLPESDEWGFAWLDSLLGVSTPRGRIEVLLGFLLGLAAGSLWSRHLLAAKEARIIDLTSNLDRARGNFSWGRIFPQETLGTIGTIAALC